MRAPVSISVLAIIFAFSAHFMASLALEFNGVTVRSVPIAAAVQTSGITSSIRITPKLKDP
jgi:hypothetical protein